MLESSKSSTTPKSPKKTATRKSTEPKIPSFLVDFVKLVEDNKANQYEYARYRQPSLLDRSHEVAFPYTILDMERAANDISDKVTHFKEVLFSTNPDDDIPAMDQSNPELIPSMLEIIHSTLRLVEAIGPNTDIFAFATIEKTLRNIKDV